MTDLAYDRWTSLGEHSVVLTPLGFQHDAADFSEADCIPDWAAIAVAAGLIIAGAGFVSLWVTDKEWPIFATVVGLVIAAIGMRAAENAVHEKSEWQPLV